ncbi:hypothetical protein PVL29_024129 [Vitis rotundifolia]|uniref:Uncharacterized protein n=1 Tax=Vitis rotundifolia TaxID=103349 RepID=A0AA38YQY4_VITRO|nr:hypothetical protein PVL29_024129 [Vitis rotundifolia]
MKRKSCSPCDSRESFFDDNELEVSEILLQIPLIIFQAENRNRLLVVWGVRKRRSAIDPDLYPPSVPSSSSPHLPGTCAGPTCDDDDPQAKVEPSSPATPLSFFPSESDGKSKRSKKSVSSKKLNHDTVIIEARVESREQVYPQQPLPLLLHDSAPTSALVANPMGPRVIPDLNVYSEETLRPELVALLDLNLSIALNADTTQLKRAAAAQARKKRLQIYKVKKPKGCSSPSILSFG